MKNLFILIFFFTAASFSTLFAQKGTLKGTVTDKTTKEMVVGAKIVLSGTSYRAISDIDGNFKIQEIPAGDYTIEVTYAMYRNFTAQVKINAQEETVFNPEMEENVTEFGPVVVTATKKTNTETAIVMEIKEAKAVVSGISKEQMSRSSDRTAAEAMQRVPGITIVEGRFALIRGVNSRYNSVMINNVIAPSTEIDRRTFSFDMVPSSSLDRMMVYKTASPEYPGDFAGGVIKLYTVNQIDKDFLNVKIETGFRAGTTFQTYMQGQGSKTDFLAFDNGFRHLPDNFPGRNIMVNEGPTSELRRDAARSLQNNYAPIESMANPNIGLAVNFGKTYKLSGVKRLTTVNSINYSQSFQNFERKFHRYQIWSDFDQPIQDWFEYTDNVYQKDNKVNIMSNWAYTLSNRSKIKFSNLFNQVGENETIIRNGENFFARPGEDQQNYLLGYKSRTIYSGQLEGDHKMGADEKNKLNWVVGGSYLGELEPDLRRFRRFKDQDSSVYTAMFSPSSNLFDNSRYYGELQEFSVSNGMNYIHDITKKKKESDKRTISAGYYSDFRSREFASRYFSTTYPGFFSPTVIKELSVLPIDEIFAPENYDTQDGLILQEGTRPIDAYSANNILTAAYVATDLTFGQFNVSGGLRTEYNIQNMESRDDFGPIIVNNPVLSLLPSANLSYVLNEKNMIRASYGRTVNRPEFRELAPFLFYDYKLESSRVGNPNLKTATIDNLDLRYENYPRTGETFSIGGFYKRFTNPIEDRLILTTEQSSLTFVNADFAYAYGAEIELKKSLKDLTKSKFIDKLSMNVNASYIVSRVDLGATATAQDRVRPLQGQAPYIVNAALYYTNNTKKMNASVIYNIYGRNIFAVGDVSFPTMYELERHSLDVTFSKGFESGLTVKAALQNILDAPFRFYQDSNRNGKIDDADDVIISFRRGSLFTLSVTYDLLRGKKDKKDKKTKEEAK
jgi:hypothetical protein